MWTVQPSVRGSITLFFISMSFKDLQDYLILWANQNTWDKTTDHSKAEKLGLPHIWFNPSSHQWGTYCIYPIISKTCFFGRQNFRFLLHLNLHFWWPIDCLQNAVFAFPKQSDFILFRFPGPFKNISLISSQLVIKGWQKPEYLQKNPLTLCKQN